MGYGEVARQRAYYIINIANGLDKSRVFCEKYILFTTNYPLEMVGILRRFQPSGIRVNLIERARGLARDFYGI